jgi:hypothetical protein
VASVEFLTRHAVECGDGTITIDGEPLRAPYRLQADGTLGA